MIRPVAIADAIEIAALYNEYVVNTTVTFEIDPVSVQDMEARIQAVLDAGCPWLVDEQNNTLAGYCCAHPWKESRPAYRYTLETTIYIAQEYQGRGLGEHMMRRLIQECRDAGFHALVACLAGGNIASERLHEKLGFKKVSFFPEVGFKFGQWLDVVDYELVLS